MAATAHNRQVQRYRSLQDDESKVTTWDLLITPDDYVAHFERYATSVVSMIGFGRRMADSKDPLITEVIDIMHRAAEMAVPAKDFPRLMETFPCKPSDCHNHTEGANSRRYIRARKVPQLDGTVETWYGTSSKSETCKA